MGTSFVRTVGLFAAGMVLCGVLAGCAKKKEAPKARPPVPVGVVRAGVRSVPVQVTGIGNVEAFSTVSVKSQLSGTVVKAHFAEGQEVRKGDVLFTIDKAPFAAAVRQAEAVLARDLAQAKNAEDQAQRYAVLVKEGIVTREQYDSYRTSADALSATVAADRATVENARIQLDYCTIRSPITGRTGTLTVNAGNVVKANETALVSINQVNPIYVTFTVPEKLFPEIKQRVAAGSLKVTASVPSDPAARETGTVSFLDNAVDLTTGMFKLKGTFANKNHKLWPGQFVNVVLTLSTMQDAVVVPQQAVQTGQKGQYVFVVKEDGTVEPRPVTASIGHGGDIVISQGLKPNETVVIDGQMRLVPGARVEVKKTGQGSGPAGTGGGGQAAAAGTRQ